MEGMKHDNRELQRAAEMAEMRYLQNKQELSAKVTEHEMKCDFAEQKLLKQTEDVARGHADLKSQQHEVVLLKAELKA